MLQRGLGCLVIALALMSFGFYFFDGHSLLSLLVGIFCLFSGGLQLIPSRHREADAIEQRRKDITARLGRMRDANPRYVLDPAYGELVVEEAQVELAWLYTAYHKRPRGVRLRDMIFRVRFPDKKEYRRYRETWLTLAANARQIHSNAVELSRRYQALT